MIRAFIDSLFGRFIAILFVGLVIFAVYKAVQAHVLQGQVVELRADLEETEGKLKAAYTAIEALERVAAGRERDRVIVREVATQIAESPNAEVLVPSDLANLWATGIDRLRVEAGVHPSELVAVRAPGAPIGGRLDSRPVDDLLTGAGSSLQ